MTLLGSIDVNVNRRILGARCGEIWHLVTGDEAGTAWWAHLGGFLAGIALLFLLRRRPDPAMA